LKIKQQELDLEKDYSGKMLNVISAQKLMTLRTADREFTRLILQQIQQRQQQSERRQQLREEQQDRLQRRNN
jgi:ERCC4-type nuclease